jgi:hypothetical protein
MQIPSHQFFEAIGFGIVLMALFCGVMIAAGLVG